MILQLYLLLSLSFFLAYFAFALWVFRQWNAIPSLVGKESMVPETLISVLVPARNELQHLPACLAAVLNQSYPPEQYEVIVIDDHSTDGSPEWIRRHYPDRVRLLSLHDFVEAQPTIAYKKAALTYGVQEAKGELIICTDADTMAGTHWLQTMARYYEGFRPGALAGPIRYLSGKGTLEQFQAVDNAATMLLTGAGLSTGKLVLGNGANLAFQKETFLRLQGYSGNENQPSGDDIFFLQKVVEAGEKVLFLKEMGAIVNTFPASQIKDLLDQRIRWAGKRVAWPLETVQVFVFGYYLTILAGFILGITIDWAILPGAIGLWILKAWIDYYWLQTGLFFLEQPQLIKGYPLLALAYLPYILWVGLNGVTRKKVSWKGREYTTRA